MAQLIRFPAEWEPHEATLFTWPWNGRIWREDHAEAQRAIALAIAALTHFEPVVVLVPDHRRARNVRAQVEAMSGDPERVECVIVPSNDVWVRDHGPTFVTSDEGRRAVDWNFDAWGGKFPHAQDARVAAKAAARFRVPIEKAPFVLEGGAIETDGKGTLLTTESVVLNPNRNASLSHDDATESLKELLGVDEVVWLKRGMASDDTDGHIDTLARFTPSGTILVHAVEDLEHPDAEVLADNELTLRRHERWPIRAIPADTVRSAQGDVLPASYMNFYAGNGVVLVPAYDVSSDADALRMVGDAFPGYETVQIPCRALVGQGGAIHCATQQVPAA